MINRIVSSTSQRDKYPRTTNHRFLRLRLKGKLVSLKDALDGCERILHDEFKDVPESALYMIGSIDEAKVKVPKEDKHVITEHAA